jgi:hypothetical protein
MAPKPTAQKNHEELFPGRFSTLAVTDPELIEYFDNFAFDEVLRDGKLDARAAAGRPVDDHPRNPGRERTGRPEGDCR